MQMPAPAKTGTRSPFDLPRIPRVSQPGESVGATTESDEYNQVQHLVWRLDLFLKDANASKERRKEFTDELTRMRSRGAPYEQLVAKIEEHMNGFLAAQLKNIQMLYREK
jgi:hypothetical protein